MQNGKDAVPTLEFKTKESCELFVREIKNQIKVETKYLCIKNEN